MQRGNDNDRPFAPRFRGGAHSRKKIVVLAAFAALVGAAAFVVFMLPSRISQTPTIVEPRPVPSAPSAASPSAPPIAQANPAAVDADKAEADKLLTESLRRLTQLESDGARIWGSDSFATSLPEAEKKLAAARAHFDDRKYGPSLPLFRDAIADFDRLAESKPERFEAAMDRGRKALENEDAPAAMRQFEIALAIMPAHGEAKAYLERARMLPAVLEDVVKGKEAEAAGDLDRARDRFKSAADRDPAFAPAREHLSRVVAAISARDYRQAISDALGRLEKQDFKGAQAAIDRAGKIKPNAPEVDEIGGRIRTQAQLAALDALRRRAAAAEREEKWSDALNLYGQALKIDGTAGFAVRGRDRAQTFVDFHKAVDAYLADPTRLQSPEPLAHAKTLLAEAAKLEDAGKVLREKTARLERSISQAEAPVPVIVESDRATEVTVYRVGRLGTFDTRRVELKPGRYTAVGTRTGYRDVRVEFQVTPSSKGETIVVRCTDPIK